MVLRNCLGMIMSVSTLIIGNGAATPVSLSNFCMARLGGNARAGLCHGVRSTTRVPAMSPCVTKAEHRRSIVIGVALDQRPVAVDLALFGDVDDLVAVESDLAAAQRLVIVQAQRVAVDMPLALIGAVGARAVDAAVG